MIFAPLIGFIPVLRLADKQLSLLIFLNKHLKKKSTRSSDRTGNVRDKILNYYCDLIMEECY